jgi:hypothetical protein
VQDLLPKLDDRMMDLAQSFIREHTGMELRRRAR